MFNLAALAPKMMFLVGSVWTKVTSGANNISSNLTKICMPISICMFIVAGLLWLFGQNSSQKAKGLMTAVVIGATVVLLAPAIIQAVWNIFGGGTF